MNANRPTKELSLSSKAENSFITLESKEIIVIESFKTKKMEYKMPEENKVPSDSKKYILDLETENYELKKENLKLRKEIDKLRSKNKPLPSTKMF